MQVQKTVVTVATEQVIARAVGVAKAAVFDASTTMENACTVKVRAKRSTNDTDTHPSKKVEPSAHTETLRFLFTKVGLTFYKTIE